MKYAMIAKREMYGQEDTLRVIGITEDRSEAERWASEYSPDYREDMGCCELSHGQASGTRGIVCEVVLDRDPMDWEGDLPDVARLMRMSGWYIAGPDTHGCHWMPSAMDRLWCDCSTTSRAGAISRVRFPARD